MQNDIYARIRSNPKFAELVSKRSSFAWVLSIAMLVVYYGFIGVVAFKKELLGAPLSPGSILTVGFPIGVGIIVCAVVLTGIYVRRANTEFDDLTKQIIEESK
jgi:uncharacterized membrane protein (DUF485 family)